MPYNNVAKDIEANLVWLKRSLYDRYDELTKRQTEELFYLEEALSLLRSEYVERREVVSPNQMRMF